MSYFNIPTLNKVINTKINNSKSVRINTENMCQPQLKINLKVCFTLLNNSDEWNNAKLVSRK